MSVMLGVQWESGEYECGNSISQDVAQRIAAWARERGLPQLAELDSNVFPQFTSATLGDLIAEFEQLHAWWAEQNSATSNIADLFLPRLRELRNLDGWTDGDFG